MIVLYLYMVPLIFLAIYSKYTKYDNHVWQSKEMMWLPIANLLFMYMVIVGGIYNFIERKIK